MSSPFIIIDEITNEIENVNSKIAEVTTVADTISSNVNNIKTYTATNNTSSKTGTLSQKMAYIIALLENSTYGLSKIKSASVIKSIQSGVISWEQVTYQSIDYVTSVVYVPSKTVTISSVNTAKAMLLNLGFNNMERNSSSSSYRYGTGAYLQLTNSTTITASATNQGSDSETMYVSYMVVEFV